MLWRPSPPRVGPLGRCTALLAVAALEQRLLSSGQPSLTACQVRGALLWRWAAAANRAAQTLMNTRCRAAAGGKGMRQPCRDRQDPGSTGNIHCSGAVLAAGNLLSAACGPVSSPLRAVLRSPQLWSPEQPHLYDVDVRLVHPSEEGISCEELSRQLWRQVPPASKAGSRAQGVWGSAYPGTAASLCCLRGSSGPALRLAHSPDLDWSGCGQRLQRTLEGGMPALAGWCSQAQRCSRSEAGRCVQVGRPSLLQQLVQRAAAAWASAQSVLRLPSLGHRVGPANLHSAQRCQRSNSTPGCPFPA